MGVLTSPNPVIINTPSVIKCKIQASWFVDGKLLPFLAVIDSGVEDNFLDEQVVAQAGCKLEVLERPIKVYALNGRILGMVKHHTIPMEMVLSGNHHEMVTFHIFQSPHSPLVLGDPWLKMLNPHIDWSQGRIIGYSPHCHALCLYLALPLAGGSSNFSNLSDSVDFFCIPPAYHDLWEVFSKECPLSLSPHRPYDCTIDLLPGAPLPSCRFYNLSQPEQEAMEQYIKDFLAAGIIRPSSSPVGAGFFFVSKKDKSLRPCIDFCGLDDITVKNKYPLPLMNSAFVSLQEGAIFTKLDLRNAYHLGRISKGDK